MNIDIPPEMLPDEDEPSDEEKEALMRRLFAAGSLSYDDLIKELEGAKRPT